MKKILLILLLVPTINFSQNTGLNLDGNGDYIVTGFNGIAGSASRTVQCWFKGGFSSNQRFFVDMGTLNAPYNGARFSFKINPSASVARIEIGGGGLNGSTNIRDGVWHQLTVTYDNSATTNKYKIYVDGVLDVQGDISAGTLNTPATSTSPMTIGIRTNLTASTAVSGDLDEVRIWNKALSASEISANWNSELCGTPAGLVAYYKMNEGIAGGTNTSITSLIDEVTPASINTLTGFSKTGTSSNYISHTIGSPASTATINPTFCSGSYTSPTGKTFTTSGIYKDTVPTTSGCDSIITINLTYTPTTSTATEVACDSYTWPINGITYNTTGSYTGKITAPGNCDSVITLNLTINTLNAGNIGIVGGKLTVVASGNKYLWLDCNNGNAPVSAADTNQSFLATANGSYACLVTNSLGCSDTTDCFVVNNVGLIKNTSDFTWSMYPNPSNGTLTLTLPTNFKEGKVTFYNTLGEIVKVISLNNTNKVANLNIMELKNGIYLIALSSEEQFSTKTILINK